MACKKCNSNKCKCDAITCINPLIYMFKGMFSLVGTDSDNLDIKELFTRIVQKNPGDQFALSFIYNIPLALTAVLTKGISIANNKNLCCPDCSNGLYYFGNVENFILLYDNTFKTGPRTCCVEHYAGIETILKLKEANNYPTCCNTDFPEQMELWINASSATSDYFYLDDLVSLGFIESSSFNGYSGIGILFNFLQLNYPELTSEDYLNILGVLSNLGVVIQCKGCEMIISSVETYLTWHESVYGEGAVPA